MCYVFAILFSSFKKISSESKADLNESNLKNKSHERDLFLSQLN